MAETFLRRDAGFCVKPMHECSHCLQNLIALFGFQVVDVGAAADSGGIVEGGRSWWQW